MNMNKTLSLLITTPSILAIVLLTGVAALLPPRLSSGERLTLAELSSLRGRNGGFLVGTFKCNDNENRVLQMGGSFPLVGFCQDPGDACTTCGTSTYSDVGQTNGSFNRGTLGQGNCGDLFNGYCDITLTCQLNPNGGDTGNPCFPPPAQPPSQNSQGGGSGD
jgi:hypothetical protein